MAKDREGRSDKRIQEIFEGDIVRLELEINDKPEKVNVRVGFGELIDLAFEYYELDYSDYYTMTCEVNGKDANSEVIGNIFQTPDTLTNLDRKKDE